MVAGSWLNQDGLYLQFGTQKAVPEQGGDFQAWGEFRVAEVLIDLTTLTTSPLVQSFTTFFPSGSNVFIEQVDVDCEVGATGGTSFSVGLGYLTPGTTTLPPAVTAISNTAFVNGALTATVATAGQKQILTVGSTGAGSLIGSTSSDTTHMNYITALAAGTFTAGKVRVRIKYRGIGTITQ